jgi:hypothetical protein
MNDEKSPFRGSLDKLRTPKMAKIICPERIHFSPIFLET